MSSRRLGFTLLEVLLATAVGAAIMAGIFSVMRVQTMSRYFGSLAVPPLPSGKP